MQTLLLVDANNLFYRSFYAVPGLCTSKGVPTNALFGFIRLLRKMLEKWTPQGAVAVFDGGLPEERKALLDSYKAQRSPMPEDLKAQIPLVERYLDAAGITRLRLNSEEADDVIASICKKMRNDFDLILIGSTDKDLYQLVDEKIRIVPLSGKGEAVGPLEVENKFGVMPSKIRDWLALAGDDSDNITGIPGIGPKTAAKLIKEFGSVETLYERLGSMPKNRIRGLLTEFKALVDRNIMILQLRDSLDTGLDKRNVGIRRPDSKALIDFFNEMEFHSLVEENRGDLFANI